VILGLEAAAEDDMDARPSHHEDHHHHHDEDGHHHHHDDDHHHDNFESIVVDIPELGDPADLVAAIEKLANENNILRVKGYAAVAGKPMRLLVQAVGARVRHQFDRPWSASEDRQGRLVVIAEHDDIKRDVIEAALGKAAKADA
jgi:cobalamin biosynthesis protein CobW